MSGKKIKKIPSLVWPGKLKTWWSFLLILSLFGSKNESLREWRRPGTLPSGPLRCFPSSDILTTVTKFWVAQKKDFLNIWGGPPSQLAPGSSLSALRPSQLAPRLNQLDPRPS